MTVMNREAIICGLEGHSRLAPLLEEVMGRSDEVLLIFPSQWQLQELSEAVRFDLSRLILVSPSPADLKHLVARGATVFNENDYKDLFLESLSNANLVNSRSNSKYTDLPTLSVLREYGIEEGISALHPTDQNQIREKLVNFLLDYATKSRDMIEFPSKRVVEELLSHSESTKAYLYFNFYEGVTTEDIEGLLLRLGDYYRALGGLGLQFDIHEEELGAGVAHAQ